MDASGWAKAPDFSGNAARAEAVRSQTLVDKHTYLEDGMTPVSCGQCGTEVLVRKNSVKHTSIQWTTDPARSCPEFANTNGGRPVGMSCPKLRRSIEHAVLEGMVHIVDKEAP